jgi:hypothetical protein
MDAILGALNVDQHREPCARRGSGSSPATLDRCIGVRAGSGRGGRFGSALAFGSLVQGPDDPPRPIDSSSAMPSPLVVDTGASSRRPLPKLILRVNPKLAGRPPCHEGSAPSAGGPTWNLVDQDPA